VRARDKEEYVCVRATKIEVTIEMRKTEWCVYTYTQHRMSLYFQNEALDSFIMDIGQTQY
jgi:hypothetical protein